jgi:hypothetical protein
MASFRSPSVPAVLALLIGAACSGKDPYNPGTPLGTFHVSAKLTASTCGTVPDPWEFDVKLAHEESTLYWIQGGAPVSGTMDKTARATMKTTDSRELRAADARKKLAACVVIRDDFLDVALAGPNADAPLATVGEATRFNGKLTYRFSPMDGSDCSDQTLDQGGDYAVLPCEVSYDLAAAQTTKPQP